MSSKRYIQLVDSAYRNNDITAMRDAYTNYQDTHCISPIRRKVYDAHTGGTRYIDTPCGTCYHCIKTKINEWTTRMYAHAEDFKHIYFVTLTYRSITNPDKDINRLFLDKLSQAVWNYDNFNQLHHYSYNPCLLVKKHYQDFLKRLRKNTGISDLTYVISGEYGKEYGRPHFHAILFSNSELSLQDVQNAWSFKIFKHHDGRFKYYTNQKDGIIYNMPIGRVDFHDLVSNGTFNTSLKIKVDGNFMNAASCFSYVCKYVVKRADANFSRVDLAYRNLFQKKKIVTENYSPYEIYFYKRCSEFTPEQIFKLLKFKLNPYEKVFFSPRNSIYAKHLQRSIACKENGYEFRKILLPEIYYDFRNLFKPFCEFSRATPIGSLYASRHLSEFKEGVFKMPLLQTCGFVVPTYFRNKADESVFGLRTLRKGIKSASFNLGNLSDLRRRLSESAATCVSLREYIPFEPTSQVINDSLQRPGRFFLDKRTKERIIFFNEHAQYYKYSRKSRSYQQNAYFPVIYIYVARSLRNSAQVERETNESNRLPE